VDDTDSGRHSLWTAKIRNSCPAFQRAYTNNPLVKMLFQRDGYEVREPELIARNELNATTLRKKMTEEGGWEKFVPSSVAKYLKASKLDERLRMVNAL
jgi:nicotinamide-nucleotide adenylyltransferase